MSEENTTRRKFLKQGTLAGLGTALSVGPKPPIRNVPSSEMKNGSIEPIEPVIDIHQHFFYEQRSGEELIQHQKTMGITQTVLLPAGSPQFRRSTHYGHANGLKANFCGGNRVCYDFAKSHKDSFLFAANEVPDLLNAVKEVEKYLKLGAKMIAEVKFGVACDSPGMQNFYQLAAEYNVPILMHWRYEVFNFGFPRFYKMLEKYPKTKFIGHAQTFWANIDKKQQEHPWELYPKGPVNKGGLTDRYLSDYENMYGGLSAGSGLNSFKRDEDFTKDFFNRHQDKLLFGSDCHDRVGKGKDCIGAQTISLIKKITPKQIERKLLFENAKKILNI